uniref:Putative LOC100575817 [Acyrthosiphon pisum] n=1 Tax=Lepeophtheirus salmonis TaxID=72036 RepID=A0A0K2TJB8_LEPSM
MDENNDAIKKVKDVLKNESLLLEIVFIQNNLNPIQVAIKALEKRLPLLTSVTIVENLCQGIILENLSKPNIWR